MNKTNKKNNNVSALFSFPPACHQIPPQTVSQTTAYAVRTQAQLITSRCVIVLACIPFLPLLIHPIFQAYCSDPLTTIHC